MSKNRFMSWNSWDRQYVADDIDGDDDNDAR